jgi:hypothetical protein
MLAEMPKNNGQLYRGDRLAERGVEPTLADLDIHPKESSRWQQMASIPDDVFLAWVDDKLSKGYELTAGGLLRLAQGRDENSVESWERHIEWILRHMRYVIADDDAEDKYRQACERFMEAVG